MSSGSSRCGFRACLATAATARFSRVAGIGSPETTKAPELSRFAGWITLPEPQKIPKELPVNTNPKH